MKHNKTCRFRLSNELLSELKEAADDNGETLSSYIRQSAISHARHRDPDTDKKILKELIALRKYVGSIGNNVNQIALQLNKGDQVEDARLKAALADLKEIRQQVVDTLQSRREAL